MEATRTLDAERILGLDLSKTSFTGCRLERKENFETRHIFKGTLNSAGKEKFLSKIQPGDYIVFEGGSSSGEFARFLKENSQAKEVLILNPKSLHKYIEGNAKTDRKDAIAIAEYIRDCSPVGWKLLKIPTAQEQVERSIVKHNIQLKQDYVRNINRLHGLFTLFGMPMLKKCDLKVAEKRHEYIATFLNREDGLLETALQIHEDLLNLEESMESSMATIREKIIFAHPKEAITWLSIPGIGILSTAALIAYLGDCSRFEKPDQLRNYVGLIPYMEQSGTSVKYIGKVVMYGCMPVRRNVMQGAWCLKTLDLPNPFTEFWKKRTQQGKKSQKTAVTVANKLLTTGWILLRKNELLRMPDYEYLKRKLRTYKINAPEMSQLMKELIPEGNC